MSSVPMPKLLGELKSRQLSALLKSIGARATGVKPDLISRLTDGLQRQRLANRDGQTRILSIDMGIKNLAFCVCDVHMPRATLTKEIPLSSKISSPRDRLRKVAEGLRPSLTVQDWKSVSLLGSLEAGIRKDAACDDSDGDVDLYHPRNMSRTALDLITNTLLPYQPSLVLIERQRFRSAGRSQVQEWTIRVNMLESMLHSILATLKQERQSVENKSFPAVCSVSPKLVTSYWLSDEAQPEDGSTSKISRESGSAGVPRRRTPAGAVKKEKTNLVREWAKTPEMAPLLLDFAGEGEWMRQILESGGRAKRNSKVTSMQTDTNHPSKLDDLADCLLQATAWVRWEANRRILLDAGLDGVGGLESLMELLKHERQHAEG